jgi:L-ascorbate metabolism protein UlaG (beta-lactamase superfamily)
VISRRSLFASLAALVAAVTGGLVVRGALGRYYDGPASDHFDGTRFFDPSGMKPRGFLDLMRWQLAGGKAAWPDWAPSPYRDHPPPRVEGDALRVSFVGHATLLIQTGGLNILTDPVWSARASPFTFAGPKRANDPGIAFDDLPPIDIVLVSHNHYDHLDVATLSRLAAAHRPRVITPLGNDAIMRASDPAIRVEAHDWGDRVDLGAGFAATLVPARHWSARGMLDRNRALWSAFVIETPGGAIYFVGDSGYGDGGHIRPVRERFGPIRLACLPIGAYEPRWFMHDQHMNPEESVRALADCGAEQALATHFGTFHLTDEPIDAPVQALERARAAAGLAPERFRALQPGQVWEL